MANTTPLNVLLVTEGSGGHLIPALEVAARLARRGARVKLWYARRRQVAALAGAWAGTHAPRAVDVDELPVPESRRLLSRLWHCGHLWSRSERCFDTFTPDVASNGAGTTMVAWLSDWDGASYNGTLHVAGLARADPLDPAVGRVGEPVEPVDDLEARSLSPSVAWGPAGAFGVAFAADTGGVYFDTVGCNP